MKTRLLITSFLFLLTSYSCSPIPQFFNILPSSKLKSVAFSETEANPIFQFYYSDTLNNAYLRELRQAYRLDSLTDQTDSEFEKIKILLNWTNKQWTHSNNTPSKPDPLTILDEAKKGNNFRCVEYGIVSAAALNSIGIPSRLLGLASADVEKVRTGAGHVVAETYSKEFKKWIFIDAQWNTIPVINNVPLNAIEFQKAIYENNVNLKIINSKGDASKEEQESYIDWIGKYLFYYTIGFDNRYRDDYQNVMVSGKPRLMLVPLNTENPTIFQRKSKIDYCIYSNNSRDFYQCPN